MAVKVDHDNVTEGPMVLSITTNYHWRPLLAREDVPKAVLRNIFDYQDKYASDGYFCYKGTWYHLDQFSRLDNFGWEGVLADSISTGVVVKMSECADFIQVGYYVS